MKTKAALVRPYSAIELNAESTVYLHVSVVVHPRHTEDNNALRLYDALEKARLLIFRMSLNYRLEGLHDLSHSLDEFGLLGILLSNQLDDSLSVFHLKPPNGFARFIATYA